MCPRWSIWSSVTELVCVTGSIGRRYRRHEPTPNRRFGRRPVLTRPFAWESLQQFAEEGPDGVEEPGVLPPWTL